MISRHFRVRRAGVLLACALLASPLHAKPEVLDRIVVVVNDGVVLQSEVDDAVVNAQSQLRERGISPPSAEALRAQVLERLVLVRLQTQRAREGGIRIDDRELNEILTNIARNNGMELGEFARTLRQQGVNYLSVREQVRDEMLVSRLRQAEVEARINVTDSDIKLFLSNQQNEDDSEYRLSHLLVSLPDGATPDQRAESQKKIAELRQRIEAGEDFAQIAIAHSDGQQALEGGDLGWKQADQLPTLFLNAARKLEPGQVSPVLEAGSGYHLVRLVERRGGDPRQMVTETRARHILLQANAIRDEEATRRQMQEVADRLKSGADFKEVAKELSDDPGSKSNGGDLGWQPPGVFAPEFQIRIDQLQPGERSAPFRSQFGWHIAEVVDRRTRDKTDESRRARAAAAIRNRKAAEEYELWLRRLRDEAYVEYRLKSDQDAAS